MGNIYYPEIKIAPSILSADYSRLGEEIKDVEKRGVDLIHIDIMDGHFVPNITLGPDVIRNIRKVTELPLDVHLMIEDPDFYIPRFIDAGADIVTFHIEIFIKEKKLDLKKLEEVYRKAEKVKYIRGGLTLNPPTSVEYFQDIFKAFVRGRASHMKQGREMFLNIRENRVFSQTALVRGKVHNNGKNAGSGKPKRIQFFTVIAGITESKVEYIGEGAQFFASRSAAGGDLPVNVFEIGCRGNIVRDKDLAAGEITYEINQFCLCRVMEKNNIVRPGDVAVIEIIPGSAPVKGMNNLAENLRFNPPAP